MTFVSYAQNFEDVLLWRALGHVKHGRYVDIGAQDPVIDSVSLAFYKAGWRGVHVEPTAAYAAKLREARPEETVIQAAVSDKPGPITFFEIPETGLSTGDEHVAATHSASGFKNQSVVVPSIRLDQILAMEDRDIHWMKIDVEGMEGAVLRSWGESAVRPWVLVIEATFPSSQKPTHTQWIAEVSKRGYEEVYFDGLSRYFVHKDRKVLTRHFSMPPNVFDGFSVSLNHFASKSVSEQLEAAASESRAKLEAVREEARREIDGARELVQAAEETAQSASAESARLRLDVSATIERLIAAQRDHRETITRLWRERQESEVSLRREGRDAIAKIEAQFAREIDQAREDRLSLVQAHSIAVASINGELNAARLRLEELHSRDASLRRDHLREIEDIRRLEGEKSRLASLEAAQAAHERDEARAEVARLRAAVNAASTKSEEANAELRRLSAVAQDASGTIQAVMAEHPSRWRRVSQERKFFNLSRLSLLIEDLAKATGSIADTKSTNFNANQHSVEGGLTMQTPLHSTERSPFQRASSIADLLAWHDVNFVRCAYVTLLGRQPDPEGEANFTAMVRSGQSKLKVLRALRSSQEGRAHDPGIAGLDHVLRQYQRRSMPGVGWLFRLAAKDPLEDGASQVRRMESAVGVLLDETRALRSEVAMAREHGNAVTGTLSLLHETGRSAEQAAAKSLAEAENLRAIMTSYVGEFRAFREEQSARAAEQSARHVAQAESAHSILTSFVGEFRAFREEAAARSRGVLENVRGLRSSLANEFDALRSEQSMRSSELKDLIDTSLDGSYRAEPSSIYTRQKVDAPEFSGLGPTSGRIAQQLRSPRN